MNQLPSNIRKEILKIVPMSIVNEIVCFAFYDHHPRDTKAIDVIVCTQRGEVSEYYKREVGCTYWLQNVKNISEIKVLRNGKCDLFYLVLTDDKLIILSRKKDKMEMLHEVDNISSYSYEDMDCRGYAQLKVVKKDDAIPLVFDENFETLHEMHLSSKESSESDTVPLLVQLQRKLSEARYCVQFNENKYKQLVELRQEAIFNIYQKRKPGDLHTSATNLKEITDILQVESKQPEVRLCNKKLLIILNITNKNPVPLNDVTVLLHTTLKNSITYTTRLYKGLSKPPFWLEKDRIIESNTMVYVIAVIDLKELQYCANSKIQFEAVLSYNKDGKSLLLPFEQVLVSASDIMGQDFDILSRKTDDESKTILCLLASCEKNILHLKHIASKPTDTVTSYEIFCTHLKMELLADNVVIHNSSPYHILHGVMVIITNSYGYNIDIEVYTRSPPQLLALIHYIYDAVPHRIIALPPNIKMTSLDDAMDEEIEDTQTLNLEELGKSLLNQTTLLKEYFDECLIKMNESKDPTVREKVGREIDMVALGQQKFLEFRRKWLDIAEEGIRGLKKPVCKDESFEMVVD